MEKDNDRKTGMNQYLTFWVDGESYAVNVTSIREVLEFQTVSKIPGMPGYMRGVINLRGKVVPVVDLKTLFNLGMTEKTISTSIIVAEMQMGEKWIITGLLTDSVNEVIEMKDADIEPTPQIGTSIDASFIQGMGKKDEKFLVILNIDKVLSNSEIKTLTA